MPAHAKTLLIDGSNAVCAIFDSWPGTREQQNVSEADFLTSLSDWASGQTQWDVEVVFDGGPRPMGLSRTDLSVRVIFSDHDTADSVILERVQALRYAQKQVSIVTWDRALAEEARSEQARIVDPKRLWNAVLSGSRLGASDSK